MDQRKIITALICLFLFTGCAGRPPLPEQQAVIQTAQAKLISKPVFGHLILLVMENLSMTDAAKDPYFQQLMKQYSYASNFYALDHPSLPNHIGLVSGDTFRFKHDCSPGENCHVAGSLTNIADQLEAANLTWKAYIEGMPQPCSTTSTDLYLVRHNPFVYFDSIRNDPARCAAHDLPFPQFQSDLENGSLPNFAWVVPDKCNGMHTQCGPDKTRIQQGVDWLSVWLPKILDSKQFQSDGVLILTFDEGVGAAGCCSQAGGGQVLTLVISKNPAVKTGGWSSGAPYNHYSILKTIEGNWGLAYLNHAGDTDIQPMWDFFK